MATEIENKDREIHLINAIDQESISSIIKKIAEINAYDDTQEKEVVGYVREPINLYITTFGGGVYHGIALIGQIQLSKTPITTIGLGMVMSMGLFIYLSGHKRISHSMTTFMYHEISMGVWDKIKGIKEEVEEIEKIQKMLDNYIINNTGILKRKLDSIKLSKKEWYLSAEEALKLNIVQEIF